MNKHLPASTGSTLAAVSPPKAAPLAMALGYRAVPVGHLLEKNDQALDSTGTFRCVSLLDIAKPITAEMTVRRTTFGTEYRF